MKWELRDEEFAAVSKISPAKRYAYMINRVADWEYIWGLEAPDGWGASADDTGANLFPVWPHERYAAACVRGDWSACKPEAIEIHEWLERWLPGLQQDGLAISAFPVPDADAAVVTPEQFRLDLEYELSRIE